MKLKISLRLPNVKEYNGLRRRVEWPTFDEASVKEALSNTPFSMVVHDEDTIVGMGRIVGDTAIYLHVADVIVHPTYQGKGSGKLIMNEVMKYVNTVGGKDTNVGWMASKGREGFYRGFGFIERPAGR